MGPAPGAEPRLTEFTEKSALHDAPKKMSKARMRSDKIFGEMEDALFDFLFRLFDPKDTGVVDTDQFVMGVGLIASASEEGNLAMQIETCFFMFDTDRTGKLSRSEFEAMVNTTIAIKLDYLLKTDTGAKVFEAQLHKEYSENERLGSQRPH